MILAPKEQIEQRIKITGRSFTSSDLFGLIHFMDYFAISYKAMVLKLLKCCRYNEEQVDIILQSESRKTMEEAYIHDCGTSFLIEHLIAHKYFFSYNNIIFVG